MAEQAPSSPSSELSALGRAALQYAAIGLPVFPCTGKRPITANGYKDASADVVQVRSWWIRWPYANIGIPTAGFIVVDVDRPDQSWPVDPSDRESLEMTAFAIARTPRGGTHYWFVQPADGFAYRNRGQWPAADVDIRADGGYCVVWPSKVNDSSYEWLTSPLDHDDDYTPSLPPQWLIDQLKGDAVPDEGGMFREVGQRTLGGPAEAGDRWEEAEAEQTDVAPWAQRSTFTPSGPIRIVGMLPEGTRHNGLVRMAAAVRRNGFTYSEIASLLQTVNHTRCQPSLPLREVEEIAKWAGEQDYSITMESVLTMRWEAMGSPLAHLTMDVGTMGADTVGKPAEDDPGPIPEALLSVPGLVGQVMDLTLETAPYPNRPLAFAGALALQSLLCARKVRDEGDLRPNVYLLALADSGSGKEWPRKVNAEILRAAGMEGALGDSIVSAAGIEDALATQPSMLFQTDEIDSLLWAMARHNADERWRGVMQILLKLFSASSGTFVRRKVKGGHFDRPAIQQPHLSLFGTAVPQHWYGAMSDRMLSNGFFARLLVVEAGTRGKGRDGRQIEVPDEITAIVKWWRENRPGSVEGTGNLEQWHPHPTTVKRSEEAGRLVSAVRADADARWQEAQDNGDQAGMTLWARCVEHVGKLALLYAVSESHEEPSIGAEAIEWARELVDHMIRKSLYQAGRFQGNEEDRGKREKVMTALRKAGGIARRRDLVRITRFKTREFDEVLAYLVQAGEVEEGTTKVKGQKVVAYRIPTEEAPDDV